MEARVNEMKHGRDVIDLCDKPWSLWCDKKAPWKDDALYLPGEFELKSLPVNPPTIGWERMYRKEGIEEDVKEVSLPTTVEEHFWGKYSYRKYNQTEYFFAHNDPQVKNGIYQGVSWWWRKIFIPKTWKGKNLRIKFPGARLRAEVYLNEQLVGYNIIAETPFEVDIIDAAQYGEPNWLAVRITNPGGRLDWPDFDLEDLGVSPLRWGDYELPLSHGFGGLDAGIKLTATDLVWVEDIFIKNKPQIREITLQITIRNALRETLKGNLTISIFPKNHPENIEWKHTAKGINLKPGKAVLSYPASMPEAKVWDLENPNLYTTRVELNIRRGEIVDTKEQNFGFRWFEVRGLGKDAKLYLNGKRIVLRSAISWGFWSLNGLFPTEELAEKEVRVAKDLGLNMLSFHRNIGRSQVLQKHDEMGLLRYEEPGAGCFSWSNHEFARRYEKKKIRRMVLRDRSHPSLVIYCIQNEQVKVPPDNPYVKEIMDLVHKLDPTRILLLKSAWSGTPPEKLGPEYGQGMSFFLPYDDTYYHDDGTGWCGWYDQHTVGGPGIYRDGLYRNPQDFSHRSDNKGEIVFWGEVLGVGTPDNLEAIHKFYQENPKTGGYNKLDHLEWHTAYDQFLEEKNFRKAFPTVGDLTTSIGNKSYYFWGRIIENIRVCNLNDGMAISGWESTTIENHSGLVDVFRNFKGDPELVRYYTRPLHLAIKSRNLVLEKDRPLTSDIYIVNEVGLNGPCSLEFKVIDPEGKVLYERSWKVKVEGDDTFGELLKEGIITDCYSLPGYYTLEASLKVGGREKVEGREKIFVIDWSSPHLTENGAILESGNSVGKFLREKKNLNLPNYSSKLKALDYILVGDKSPGAVKAEKELLDRVAKDGTTLILIANDRQIAQGWANALAKENVVEFKGMVGPARASWMGSWHVVKEHPLFESLPVNTAFNWEYQADVRGSGEFFTDADVYGADGMLLEGKNVEYVVGYSRGHDRRLGAAVAVISYGKGKIILSSIAGLYDALTDSNPALHRAVARRLLCNFIRFS
ncbi:MAG: sugar-binding domain-containing protein [bacterium]